MLNQNEYFGKGGRFQRNNVFRETAKLTIHAYFKSYTTLSSNNYQVNNYDHGSAAMF